MIDLSTTSEDPRKTTEAIMQACRDNRQLFIFDWVKNFRRIAAFTEDEIRARRKLENAGEESDVLNRRHVTSFNLTRGFYQRLLGRFMPTITDFQVLAGSEDKEDKNAAEGGGPLLKSRTAVDSGQDFEAVVEAISYLFCGGPSLLRVEGIIERDKETGKVETSSVLPFDIYYYPGIKDIHKSPGTVLIERLTRQDIERRFPELADKVENWAEMDGAKWPDDVNFGDISSEIGKGLYEIRRLFVSPCKDYPEGTQWVMFSAKDSTVRAEYPFPKNGYPFEAFRDVPMGPFYEDRGRMTISSKMQYVLDICVSKSLDILLGSATVLLNAPSGGVSRDELTNQAVCITEAPKGMEPTYQANPGIGILSEGIGMARDFMNEIHGQHPPSKGQMPGGRTSGRALEEITTADAALDAPLGAMVRRTMGRIGKRILMEGQRVWGEKHIYRVLGKHGAYETRAFLKANLKEGFDVRVLPDQGLPQNKVARMKLVIQGLKEGIFEDNPASRRARELIGVQVADNFYAVERAEEQLVRIEEDKIEQGLRVPRNWSDNDELHLNGPKGHKAAHTERLARGNVLLPITQAAMFHANKHSEEISKRMQAQMQLAAGPQAGPGAPK